MAEPCILIPQPRYTPASLQRGVALMEPVEFWQHGSLGVCLADAIVNNMPHLDGAGDRLLDHFNAKATYRLEARGGVSLRAAPLTSRSGLATGPSDG